MHILYAFYLYDKVVGFLVDLLGESEHVGFHSDLFGSEKTTDSKAVRVKCVRLGVSCVRLGLSCVRLDA